MSGGAGAVGGAGAGGGGGGAGGGMGGVAGAGAVGGGAGQGQASEVAKSGEAQGIQGIEKTNGIEQSNKVSTEQSLLEQIRKGEIGNVQGADTTNANKSNEVEKSSTETKEISGVNSIDFGDSKLSEKIFDKLAEEIDKKLMLAILMAIKNEDKEELLKLLEIAFALSAMQDLGNVIDIQG